MSPLDFLKDFTPSPERDLLSSDKPDAPREPGAYVLIAASGVTFRYPCGESPVFYIGQAKRLRRRLLTHCKNIKNARDYRSQFVYGPIREYGAAFGAHYSFLLADVGQSPQDLEHRLMAHFARQFRSLPVANRQGDWKRILGIINAQEEA